jgi:argininosuccinate synthase
MSKGKVVLAYSGGLDTSVVLKYLQNEGYEVVCFCANVGQDEDFEAAKQKALALGATKVYVEDLREDFLINYIFPAVKANAIYESRYLLGTSLARPCIAKRQIEIAHLENAEYVAHGATAKGNDQVRFGLCYFALDPNIKEFAPWREPAFLSRFKGRQDLLKYARENGIPVPSGPKPPYSMDDNMMHISYESGELEDPSVAAEESIYTKTGPAEKWPDQPQVVRVHFKDGVPVQVEDRETGSTYDTPMSLFDFLTQVARKHGIGRIDIVEDRFIGLKSRGVYETPAVTILRCAHIDIEGIAMDREVMRLRDMLSPEFSKLAYNGFWFSPEMDFLVSAINKSQELIDGWVDVRCFKGSCMAIARQSPTSLYDERLASMNEVDAFTPSDAGGFIRINAIRLKAHRHILEKVGTERLADLRPTPTPTYAALNAADS